MYDIAVGTSTAPFVENWYGKGNFRAQWSHHSLCLGLQVLLFSYTSQEGCIGRRKTITNINTYEIRWRNRKYEEGEMLCQGESKTPTCIQWKICDFIVFWVKALTIYFTLTAVWLNIYSSVLRTCNRTSCLLLIKKWNY